ncbi:hypothetical protein [Aquimarina megaterium]|uniref:hypothetical protein n=1 Tax=Aquimarina megaterium TaxID=1443666 RepID=UPI0009421C53|nr:hypothetical protein [Aquimarina megaterium]
MTEQKEMTLSSNWTTLSIYIQLLACLIGVPYMFFLFMQKEFDIGMVIFGAFVLGITALIICQFIYACDARVINDKLVLKKQFKPSKTYSFEKIRNPRSFRIKRTSYITVKMENEDKVLEKYLIINNHHLLSFENKDAKQVLISLKNMHKQINKTMNNTDSSKEYSSEMNKQL